MIVRVHRYCLLLLALIGSLYTYAYDFEVDGLCYNILSDNQVEVTYRSYQDGSYSGELKIPEKVSYNGVEYTVSAIGEYAFYNCINLTGSLLIPNSIQFIGRMAFRYCSNLVGSLTIPNSVTDIGTAAFANCKGFTGSLLIPNSVTSVSSGAFYECSGFTGSLIISNSVTVIKSYTFYNCSGFTGSLIIPSSVTSIGFAAFYCCSGFNGSLTIPDTVTELDNGVFYGCSGFTGTLTIPNSVKTIRETTFSGCSGVSRFNSCIESPFDIPTNVFENISSNAILQVPKGTKDLYSQYPGWTKNFKEIVEEPASYSFSVTSTGNGTVSFNGTAIRGTTRTFSVNEGTSATLTFSADNGYRIANLYVNGNNVTSRISNNSYTISNINQNITVGVEFEAIPPTTYTLSITASGYGTVSYNGTTIRRNTSSFTVNEGASATLTFSADNGYRIANLYVNGNNVTSSISNNSYTISNINQNTTVGVEFEAIPPTTYTLSITASGYGSVSYNGTTVRSKTSTFTVNEGSSASISFTPDNGYRIKSVKVNNTDVTSRVSNNSYTVNNISSNINVEVVFEAIPPTTYTLSINSTGNGSVSYSGTAVRNQSKSFTVNEGSTINISLYPDNGYRLKSIKVNNTDVMAYVSNGTYTINSLSRNTTIDVEFEAIPPTTYSLSITASGIGAVSFNNTTVRNQTKSFTVNEGSNATITFSPDSGYRIAIVMVNNTDVTSSVSNNRYTINNITANTTLSVVFEAIPITTYSLRITASGNGSAIYGGTTIRGTTSSFTANEGSNATITFSPDSGYRIASVKVNNTDVTSSVSNNRYTINNITANTVLSVSFEAIPITTYILSITSVGNGSVTYDGTSIRSKTSSFTVKEGSSVSISLIPDNGYRVKSVKENGTNVISYVSSNKYVISSITRNTTVEVEFEAIPPTTYTLSITASGNGSATYGGTTIRSNTSSFTVNDGDYATVTFSPDSGYRIASVKVNDIDVTSSVSDNWYTISNITENTTLSVVFEAIPPTMRTLTITASGNGDVQYGSTTVRNQTSAVEVEEGSSATVTFSPDGGNRIAAVTVNGQDVTASIENYRYTIANISGDLTIVAAFEEIINAVAYDGVNYSVVSQDDGTVKVAAGNYGQVLTVPASFTAIDRTWQVMGIEADALKDNVGLAAVIWDPEVAFTATVSNPNLLLYVKSESYAPRAIHNVVVNGTAANIMLVEAVDDNDFYCPQAFTAQHISFAHNYQMQTGLGESKGWETIALPFDVQTITHETKGTIVPFANWKNGDTSKPFWLMELTGTGFVEAGSIKAYTPYIISMPNHPQYDSQWLLNGKVTFAASSVTVGKTEDLNQSVFNGRTFIPCFAGKKVDEGFYALNVNNDWETNNSGMTEGSMFVWRLRNVHPFEAYLTSSSSAPRYAIGVFEDMTTGIKQMVDGRWMIEDAVYDLQGRKVESPSTKGVYIVNGKKKVVK